MLSRFIYYPGDSDNPGRDQKDENRDGKSKAKTDEGGEIQKSADTGTDAWGREADNMKPKDSTYGDDTYSGVSS